MLLATLVTTTTLLSSKPPQQQKQQTLPSQSRTDDIVYCYTTIFLVPFKQSEAKRVVGQSLFKVKKSLWKHLFINSLEYAVYKDNTYYKDYEKNQFPPFAHCLFQRL